MLLAWIRSLAVGLPANSRRPTLPPNFSAAAAMPATRLRGGGCAPSKPDGPPSLDAINRGLPQKPQEQSMSEAVLGQTIAASAPVAVASIVLETSKDAPAPAPPPSVVVPDDADAPAADANAPAAEKKQRRPSAEGARRVAANDVFGNYNTVPSRRLSRDPSQQVPTQFGLLAREQSLAAEEASPEIVIQKSKAERDAKSLDGRVLMRQGGG